MTSNQHGPYVRGDTRVTMVGTEGSHPVMGANLESLSQFGLEAETRLHEVGFASNRASAMAREYVLGLVHTARQAMGVGVPEVRDRKERPRAKPMTGAKS